jgi:hypothetical protein
LYRAVTDLYPFLNAISDELRHVIWQWIDSDHHVVSEKRQVQMLVVRAYPAQISALPKLKHKLKPV